MDLNTTPPGYPAPPGSFGLHFDRSPKARCSSCDYFTTEDDTGATVCEMARRPDGTVPAPIKKTAAACKHYTKKPPKPREKKREVVGDTERIRNEEPTHGTSERGLDLFTI